MTYSQIVLTGIVKQDSFCSQEQCEALIIFQFQRTRGLTRDLRLLKSLSFLGPRLLQVSLSFATRWNSNFLNSKVSAQELSLLPAALTQVQSFPFTSTCMNLCWGSGSYKHLCAVGTAAQPGAPFKVVQAGSQKPAVKFTADSQTSCQHALQHTLLQPLLYQR